MALESLGGKFELCARALLKEAVGEEPPPTFPTAIVENMVRSIVEPKPGISVDFCYNALGSALSYSHGKAKSLSRDEMETVIRRHFELK